MSARGYAGVVKPVAVAVGLVLALAGTVFFFQGIDVLKGSTMTGETRWAIIGPIVAVVGLALIVAGLRRGRTNPDQGR